MIRALSHATLVLALAGCAFPAVAQHKHAHPLKSRHGGEVIEGRRHHFELVLLPKARGSGEIEVSLYVTNHHNKPVKLESASAEALARSGGRQTRIALVLAEPDVLKGSGQFAPAADLVVEVSVSIGKLPVEKLVFRPLAASR